MIVNPSVNPSVNPIVARRPAGVTITAWLWIAMGGLMMFAALMGAIAYSMMSAMGGFPNDPPPGMPAGFALVHGVFQFFPVFLALQAVVAVLGLWAGIGLLRLKAWARTAIEVLSWIGLLYTVGFGLFWVAGWVSMTGTMPDLGVAIDPGLFRITGAVMGTVITVALAAPLWIMIRYLRSEEVRKAVATTGNANA